MEKIYKFIILLEFIFITILFIFCTILSIKLINYRNNKQTVEKTDTIYNRVVLDSIQYRINTIDSSIYKSKIKYKEYVEKSKNLNYNDAVKLFYEFIES